MEQNYVTVTLWVQLSKLNTTKRKQKEKNVQQQHIFHIQYLGLKHFMITSTRSSAIAEGPRDASCQLKTCQLPHNRAETTYTTSPDQIDGMKLEI